MSCSPVLIHLSAAAGAATPSDTYTLALAQSQQTRETFFVFKVWISPRAAGSFCDDRAMTTPSQHGHSIAWQDETRIPALACADPAGRCIEKLNNRALQTANGERPEAGSCGAAGLPSKSYRPSRPSVSLSAVPFLSSTSLTDIFCFILGRSIL